MTIPRSRRSFALAAVVAGSFLFGACGSAMNAADSAGTATVAESVTPSTLRPIRVDAGQSGGSSDKLAADSAAAQAEMSMRMAWLNYIVEGQLPDLGAVAPAWLFEPGAPISVDQVVSLAAAFGITGEPTEVAVDLGGGWQIGPTDGSGPALTVTGSAMQDWYFSPAWNTSVSTSGCAMPAIEPGSDVVTDVTTGVTDGAEGSTTDSTTDAVVEPASEPPVFDTEIASPECAEPAPPQEVPSIDEAIATTRELMTAAGIDTAGFAFEGSGDEWGAYVMAVPLLGEFRSPFSTSFSFGEFGAITWASGTLAQPIAVGDYPLIATAAGVDRLNEQNLQYNEYVRIDSVGVEVDPAATESVGEPVAGDSVVASPIDASPIDASPIEVVITGVRQDLTSVWDVDGTVWLLPAYTYTNADGDVATIAAVTDDYLVVPEFEPGLSTDPAPVPAPLPEISVTPAAPELIGLDEASAAAEAKSLGFEVRVISIDGESLPVTADYSETRVNLTLVSGIVTETSIG